MALENAVVEHEINKVELVADQDALLPRLETEAPPQFEQEFLYLIQQGVFQSRFAHDFLGSDSEEFDHVGVAEDQGGLVGLPFGSQRLPNLRIRQVKIESGRVHEFSLVSPMISPGSLGCLPQRRGWAR